jgi:hypothetical protein
MSRHRELVLLCLFAFGVAVVASLGIGARATYGAQTTADEPQYLLSALSLWEDGDLDISDELADERYREFHEADLPEQTVALEDGRRVSPHDPLLPLLLAVPMGLGGWVVAKATLAVVGGAVAALTVWTARHRLGLSPSTAYLTAGVFWLAPPLAVYSTQVYPEIVAAFAVLAGFSALVGLFERRGRIVLVLAVIALPWLAVKYVPVATVLAFAGLVRAGKGRRFPLLTMFAVAGVVYVAGHLVIFDGLTAYAAGDHFVGGEFTSVGSEINLWGRSTRLIGLLVDRGFGIAAWQPAFLIMPLVAGWAIARRREHGVATALWLVVAGWLVATFVALTMHGWWFPGRQLVVVLPIAVLLVGVWVDEARSRRLRLVVPLGLLGVVAYVFLAVEGLQESLTWVVDFGATANPFYRVVRTVLPDYMAPGTTTWVLHGVWTSVALVLGWLGWRSRARGSSSRAPESSKATNHERVLT